MGTDLFGLIIAVIGIVCVTGSTIVNFFLMNHGSSGQIVIDENLKRVLWPALTGVIIMVIGFVLWVSLSVYEHKFSVTFLLAFSSYFISMFALLFSLYQVNLTVQ